MNSRALLVSLLVLLAWTGPALADRDKARVHFQRGTSFYNLSRFEDALKEYETAYLEHPDPVFLFNIGQCYRQLGQHELAIRSYRNYLRTADNPPNRADVEEKIKELEAALRAGGKPAAPPPVTPVAPAARPPAPAAPPERKAPESPPPVAPPPVAPAQVAKAPPPDPAPTAPGAVAPPVPERTVPLSGRDLADRRQEDESGGKGWLLWAGVGAGVVAAAVLVLVLSSGGPERPPCPEGIRCF